MKKHLFCLAILAAAALAGCQQKEQQPSEEGGNTSQNGLTAPTLSAGASSVVLQEASAASAALKLDWTAAANGVDVSYDLYVNLSSRDLFTSPVKVAAGKALSHTFTHGELNAALTTLGVTAATEIQFGVYASASGFDSVLSNLVKLQLTPYSEAFRNPEAVYVIGTATPYAWDLNAALRITPSQTGVYKASSLPLRTMPVSNNQSIKFAFSRDGSDPRFAGQKPGAAFGEITVVETGQGYEFFPATAGYQNGLYDITVDFNTMRFSLTRKGDLPEETLPDKLWLLGNCFEWTWNFTGTTLDKVSGNVYEAKGINMRFGDDQNPLGFKIFLKENQWSPYFAMAADATKDNVKVMKVEDTDVPQFYPGKLGYTDGVYDIKVDFGAMLATFTRKGDIPSGGNLPEVMYLHGGCFTPVWDFSDDLVLTKTASGIYEGDIAIQEANEWDGFKIWTDKNWTKWYGAATNSTHDEIIIVDGKAYCDENNLADAQIYPVTLGYAPGTWHFRLDMNNMRLQLTK